jgi:cobalt-zinc-cadmium efflux system protein
MNQTNSHSHHHHDHHHHHADGTKSLALAFFLNLSFALIEIAGGLLSNSVAILSDSVHDLGDCVALGMAWRFEKLSHKKRDEEYHYGYRRYSILGALITIAILTMGSFALFLHSIQRLFKPENVEPNTMIALAILGLLVNGFAAWKVSRHDSHSHKAASLHLLEDVLGWVAVLVGGILIHLTGAMWIDPALSISINIFVFWQAQKRIKQILPIIMQSSPLQLKTKSIRSEILKLAVVKDVHSIQAWTLDGQHHVLSCHIVVDSNSIDGLIRLKKQTKDLLLKHNIVDSTLEFEFENEECHD